MELPGWNSIPTTAVFSSFFFWASIGALVLLGLSEVLSHRYGERHDLLIAQQQQAAKDASDGEIARLHRDTAEANARALVAELRIKQLEPRNLNWNAFVDALKGAPKGKVEILYFADDFDSMALAQQIAFGIATAGWEPPTRGPIEKPLDWSGPTPMAVGGQPTGITVVTASEAGEETIGGGTMLLPDEGPPTPSKALARAILAGVGRVATHIGGSRVPGAGVVRIVVAPRG